jgi:hypothetical protein
MVGSSVLSAPEHLESLLAYECQAESKLPTWEWRLLVDKQWLALPQYVAGVLEGAFRNGERGTRVQLHGNRKYLIADLEEFRIALTENKHFSHTPFTWNQVSRTVPQYTPVGSWLKLTRFFKGCPSTTPDRRLPSDLASGCDDDINEVDDINDEDVLRVRTLTGKLVYCSRKADSHCISIAKILDMIAVQLGKSPKQLQLLQGGQMMDDGTDAFTALLQEEGSCDLMLLMAEPAPAKNMLAYEKIEEYIPDELPGVRDDLDPFVQAIQRE